ncbi:MAG: cytochrome c oxidase subunit I [Bryobacteraceae bacterium]|nr:cytochrome c oxidase subunit I [Bryobacteraceae bacterium]
MSPPGAALDSQADAAALRAAWSNRRGFYGWITEVDHKSIGKRYIVTAFVFLLLAGIEALLMRLQLSRPENGFLDPDLYNQVFTMHGTTMMFLFATPVMEGFGLYFVPLMVGTRNVAFPRLAAFSYWMYLFGGIFLYAGFVTNTGADAGWFAYVPLSGPEFSPGKRVDFWAQMITFTEISALSTAVDLIVTILRMRAPGMSLSRMPLYVWAMLVQSFMIVFAMPAVMLASSMLLADRTVGTHFFNPGETADPLLWQHLFWFFGHPEVYIIFIPALGMISSIIETFARRPVFGYPAMTLSLIATAFMGFGLWAHHMFTTGLPPATEAFFTAASIMIAIPSGVQVFCWLATLWSGDICWSTALRFVLAFFALFVAGGLTGVMIASVPFDTQAHDTFFIVAHFHYVLIGGAVFPLLGAVYYWFPKFTGRLLSERLGRLNFWVTFVGFNLTFFPMHYLGLKGMPRRVYTYTPEMGWGALNLLATCGAAILAMGGLLFLGNVFWSMTSRRTAGNNPWAAATLEWAADSPPEPYSFQELPAVSSREPMWSEAHDLAHVTGLAEDRRQTLVTSTVSARPQHRYSLPGPTLWPLLAALAVSSAFVGSVFRPIWVIYGAILTFFALLGWFWPKDYWE